MIVAVFIGMLGVPHLVEGIRGGDPQLLRLEHLDVAIFSFVAAYAMWTDKQWAPWALAVALVRCSRWTQCHALASGPARHRLR
jgi:hypothetical protein